MTNPIFLALDTDDLQNAESLLKDVGDLVGGVKFGLRFFIHHGLAGTSRMSQIGATKYRPWFLDLKFYDIPKTVAGAVQAIIPAHPDFLTIHCAGGVRMMRAAVDAMAGLQQRPRLLGVTSLTSLEIKPETVLAHASGAFLAGLDGVVCAAHEAHMLRTALGSGFILMVPGIREHMPPDDQVRVATPVQAIQAGANYLVIGREITAAASPRAAVNGILSRLAAHDFNRSPNHPA